MIELPDDIFKQMTSKEQDEHFMNSMSGMQMNHPGGGMTVLMGKEAMNRRDDYINKMIKKYGNSKDKSSEI